MDKYFEKRLNDIEVYKIEKHLEKCNSCKKEYDEFKEVFDLLASHPIVLPPEDFASRIMNKIDPKTNQFPTYFPVRVNHAFALENTSDHPIYKNYKGFDKKWFSIEDQIIAKIVNSDENEMSNIKKDLRDLWF